MQKAKILIALSFFLLVLSACSNDEKIFPRLKIQIKK